MANITLISGSTSAVPNSSEHLAESWKNGFNRRNAGPHWKIYRAGICGYQLNTVPGLDNALAFYRHCGQKPDLSAVALAQSMMIVVNDLLWNIDKIEAVKFGTMVG